MTDIPVYVSCKFEMNILKIALVIIENVRIVFLYVLNIFDLLLIHTSAISGFGSNAF